MWRFPCNIECLFCLIQWIFFFVETFYEMTFRMACLLFDIRIEIWSYCTIREYSNVLIWTICILILCLNVDIYWRYAWWWVQCLLITKLNQVRWLSFLKRTRWQCKWKEICKYYYSIFYHWKFVFIIFLLLLVYNKDCYYKLKNKWSQK